MASVSLNCFTRSPCSRAAASRGPSTVLLNKEKQGANADKKLHHLYSNSTAQAPPFFFHIPIVDITGRQVHGFTFKYSNGNFL